MKISVFDTSICSLNSGDNIIMESVEREIDSIFQNHMKIRIPSQIKLSGLAYRALATSKYKFVGGTNLLSSHMSLRAQWKVGLLDSLFISEVILFGVGWRQYQTRPDIYTRILLNRLLTKNYIHSVRDNYTLNLLNSIGIKNVLNTSCPTMWMLDQDHCQKIPLLKGDEVLLTLTDYNKDIKNDIELIDVLSTKYSRIYFWPQGTGDIEYINELNVGNKLHILNEGLKSLDFILTSSHLSLDYVGTRLHAGIRAMQHLRRAIIIGIDNRALEKSKDFNLTVVKRGDKDKLINMIDKKWPTEIALPLSDIKEWKSQFK